MTDPARESTAPTRSRRRAVLAAGAVAVAAAVAVALATRPDAGGGVAAGGDRDAPTFAVPDLVEPDRTITLGDSRGKPVVLNFWASWCVPCRREMPAFQATYRQLGDDIAFLGINHQDDRDAALDLLGETGVTYPSGFDPEGKVAAGYGLFGMPTTVFITTDGKIAAQRTGELSRGELERAIEEHLLQP